MHIDWLTVAAQIVNFLILVWLLRRFLYQPVVSAMARREARIGQRLREADEREGEAAKQARSFREKSAALEQAREEKLEQARVAAEQEKRRLVGEARRQVDRQHDKWREDLQREQDDLRKALQRELAESAARVARRVLADLADAALERQVVAALLRRIAALPQDERRDLTQSAEALRVTSAFELDGGQREALRKALGAGAGIEFARDGELVCGIALAAAGHKLAWNVADYLGDFEERVDALLAQRATQRPEPGAGADRE